MEPARNSRDDTAGGAAKATQHMNKSKARAKASVPLRFRRLKWNEVVSRGDFVSDEHRGFEPWEGPGGFRADAFVKTIYRRYKSH
jgi:hypothetical protein